MTPYSVVTQYNYGGQAGLAINQNYDDVYASVTGYTPDNVPIAYPGSGHGSIFDTGNILATVVHAGRSNMDGTTNCLEAGSVYETNDGNNEQPSATFAVGNFCSNPNADIEDFPVQIPIDFNFQNNYERDLGDGLPKYTVELYQPLGGDGSWHAIIWNYAQNNWQDLGHWYTTYPASRDNAVTYGWALMETHYYPGGCSSFYRTMSISNIQVAVETGNDQQNYFRNPNSGDVAFDPLNDGNPAQCFSNDNSGLGAIYNFSWTNYPYAWNTTDPKPGPSPTPRPKPTPCGNAVVQPNTCPLSRSKGTVSTNTVCCY